MLSRNLVKAIPRPAYTSRTLANEAYREKIEQRGEPGKKSPGAGHHPTPAKKVLLSGLLAETNAEDVRRLVADVMQTQKDTIQAIELLPNINLRPTGQCVISFHTPSHATTFTQSLKTTTLGGSGPLTAIGMHPFYRAYNQLNFRSPLSMRAPKTAKGFVDFAGRAVLLSGIPQHVTAGTVLAMLKEKEFYPVRGPTPRDQERTLNHQQQKIHTDETANGMFVYVADVSRGDAFPGLLVRLPTVSEAYRMQRAFNCTQQVFQQASQQSYTIKAQVVH